jgi:uncharacterized protein (DUF1778 family)
MAATARLEVRVRPESKAKIALAADLVNLPVSDFVRSAAEDRAEQILREYESQTRVPAAFFDSLLEALDDSARPSAALQRAAGRARDVVTG